MCSTPVGIETGGTASRSEELLEGHPCSTPVGIETGRNSRSPPVDALRLVGRAVLNARGHRDGRNSSGTHAAVACSR